MKNVEVSFSTSSNYVVGATWWRILDTLLANSDAETQDGGVASDLHFEMSVLAVNGVLNPPATLEDQGT